MSSKSAWFPADMSCRNLVWHCCYNTNDQTHKCSFSQTACKGAGPLSDHTESLRKFPICLRSREPRHCSFGLVAFSCNHEWAHLEVGQSVHCSTLQLLEFLPCSCLHPLGSMDTCLAQGHHSHREFPGRQGSRVGRTQMLCD